MPSQSSLLYYIYSLCIVGNQSYGSLLTFCSGQLTTATHTYTQAKAIYWSSQHKLWCELFLSNYFPHTAPQHPLLGLPLLQNFTLISGWLMFVSIAQRFCNNHKFALWYLRFCLSGGRAGVFLVNDKHNGLNLLFTIKTTY